MNDISPQLEHRDRQSGGGGWLIAIFVVVVLYVLSPPLVFLAFGPNVVMNGLYRAFYAPISFLAHNSEPVHEFYSWYYKACGILL